MIRFVPNHYFWNLGILYVKRIHLYKEDILVQKARPALCHVFTLGAVASGGCGPLSTTWTESGGEMVFSNVEDAGAD